MKKMALVFALAFLLIATSAFAGPINIMPSVGQAYSAITGYMSLTSSGWPTEWIRVSGSTYDAPALASIGDDIHLVVRGSSNYIYHKKWSEASGWDANWVKVPGTTTSVPVLTSEKDKLYLVVRGTSDPSVMYYKWWSEYKGWSKEWIRISGATNDDPRLVSSPDHVHLVVRGVNNHVYHKFLDTTKQYVIGAATATDAVEYGDYSVYADLGTQDSWARIVIKNSDDNTVDTFILNKSSYKKSTASGLTIRLLSINALSDGTVTNAELIVDEDVSIGTATATTPVVCGDYSVYADLGSDNSWTRIIISGSSGSIVDTLTINQGDSKVSITSGLIVKVDKVRALLDGSIVGADLMIFPMYGGVWSKWYDVGLETDVAPAAETTYETLFVAAKHPDGNVYFKVWEGPDSGWSPTLYTLGTMPGSAESSPAIAYLYNSLNIVIRAQSTNDIWHVQGYFGPTTWRQIPGKTGSSPHMISIGEKVHLLIRGLESDNIYHKSYSRADGWDNEWADLSGSTPSEIALAEVSEKLHVVVRGEDNSIYHKYWDPTAPTTTTTTTIPRCTDSDGGKNYYMKGFLDVGCPEGADCGVFNDYCKDAYVLVENFCVNGEPSEELYNCDYGCEDGACLKRPVECTDSDGGKNYYVRGVVETSTGQRRTDSCTYCTGACEPGTTVCETTCGAVIEYYCYGSEIKSTTFTCPSGYTCKEGACVRWEPTECEGNVYLSLSQYSVAPSSRVGAYFGGLRNCDTSKIKIRKDSCYGEDVCRGTIGCTIGPIIVPVYPIATATAYARPITGQPTLVDTTQTTYIAYPTPVYPTPYYPIYPYPVYPYYDMTCYCSFNAPGEPGYYTYHACIDKNEDGDFNDYGEHDSKDLYVRDIRLFRIDFQDGWNMFSWPVSENNYQINYISPSCEAIGSAWHYSNGRYERVSGPKAGEGYWIKMRVKDAGVCYMTVYGDDISIGDFPTLNPGWNQIGAPSQTVKFSEVVGDCEVIGGPWLYNTRERRYEKSDYLVPGKGYWVAVSSSCRLGPELPPPPPTITTTTTLYPVVPCSPCFGGSDLAYIDHSETELLVRVGPRAIRYWGVEYDSGEQIRIELGSMCAAGWKNCDVTLTYTVAGSGLVHEAEATLHNP